MDFPLAAARFEKMKLPLGGASDLLSVCRRIRDRIVLAPEPDHPPPLALALLSPFSLLREI